MRYLQGTFLLLLLYLALTMNLQLNNILVGLVVAALVAALVGSSVKPLRVQRLPALVLAAARYMLIVIVDVVKGGLTVGRIVLDPKLPIRPGIVAIPSGTESEVATALSAHAITISPGEMVISIGQDNVMYTHCLDATKAAEYAQEAQRLRRELLCRLVS